MEDDIRRILLNWDIPCDLPMRASEENSVWFIGEQYVLKACAQGLAQNNFRILKALAEQGFAAAPRYTRTGDEYAQLSPAF